jgi:hypothetical protein
VLSSRIFQITARLNSVEGQGEHTVCPVGRPGGADPKVQVVDHLVVDLAYHEPPKLGLDPLHDQGFVLALGARPVARAVLDAPPLDQIA